MCKTSSRWFFISWFVFLEDHCYKITEMEGPPYYYLIWLNTSTTADRFIGQARCTTTNRWAPQKIKNGYGQEGWPGLDSWKSSLKQTPTLPCILFSRRIYCVETETKDFSFHFFLCKTLESVAHITKPDHRAHFTWTTKLYRVSILFNISLFRDLFCINS